MSVVYKNEKLYFNLANLKSKTTLFYKKKNFNNFISYLCKVVLYIYEYRYLKNKIAILNHYFFFIRKQTKMADKSYEISSCEIYVRELL